MMHNPAENVTNKGAEVRVRTWLTFLGLPNHFTVLFQCISAVRNEA